MADSSTKQADSCTEFVHIENWSCTSARGPYTLSLQGNVFNHPDFTDGTRVLTGTILTHEGRLAHGRRTTYMLGSIHPDYLAWCQQNLPNYKHNPDMPIRKGVQVSRASNNSVDDEDTFIYLQSFGAPSAEAQVRYWREQRAKGSTK